MNSISLDDLVQYLYRETPPGKTEEIERALLTDGELREKLETLELSRKRLDSLKLSSPNEESISKILAYSKQYKQGNS